MHSSLILIADSGSTKTHWALLHPDGHQLCRLTTQGINPFHQTPETIEGILREEFSPFTLNSSLLKVHFYGSGCTPEAAPVMEKILRRCFPQATQITVESDMVGAARAVWAANSSLSKGDHSGSPLRLHSSLLVSILGTGAASCLFDGQHILRSTPSLGYVLGDEGSGAALGKLFLEALFRGFLPQSLRQAWIEETGLQMADVLSRVYREPMPSRFLASTAPFIKAHLQEEPQLRELVIKNFQNHFRRLVAPYGRPDLPFGAVGSIAFHFAPELREAARLEGFRLHAIIQSPIEGLVRGLPWPEPGPREA